MVRKRAYPEREHPLPALLQGLTCLESPKIPPLAREGVLLPGCGGCRLGPVLGPGDPSPEESSVSEAGGEARVRVGIKPFQITLNNQAPPATESWESP